MSRVAKKIIIPIGVEVKIYGNNIEMKGKKGELSRNIHKDIILLINDNKINISIREYGFDSWAQAGTVRAILQSMIIGVTKGFEKKLKLIGVGYRAVTKGNVLNLSLGFSHKIEYPIPEGINAECPNQNEIVLHGADKQMIGQIAANIRAYRKPEPYKGKGVRYLEELVHTKEAKKK